MKKILLTLFFIFYSFLVFGQTDSLVFNNGNYIVGEIKSMNKGVLVFETDYSDSDFKIEIEGIKKIFTTSHIAITLSDGTRMDGKLKSLENGKIEVITDEGTEIVNNINDIVLMKTVDKGFWDRFSASIDLGFNITKANNFKQLSSRSSIGYQTEKWMLGAYYNTVLSTQDSSSAIKRIESGLTYTLLLPKDWYLPATTEFLSNNEQKLKLRSTVKLGAGKYILHTNSVYWSFGGGFNYNNENYTSEEVPRNSMEGYFGTEFNMFDVGDLNILTNIFVYPSITESNRWRFDYNLDIKYDLPLDFYLSVGTTINFDNQPVADASRLDYVVQTGLGWEW